MSFSATLSSTSLYSISDGELSHRESKDQSGDEVGGGGGRAIWEGLRWALEQVESMNSDSIVMQHTRAYPLKTIGEVQAAEMGADSG